MQQPISRPAPHVRKKAHAKSTAHAGTQSRDLTWKLAAAVVGGYLAVVAIVGLAILTIHALSVMFGAYHP